MTLTLAVVGRGRVGAMAHPRSVQAVLTCDLRREAAATALHDAAAEPFRKTIG